MRKKLVKISKRFLILILLMVLLSLIFPTWTPGIRGENSISTMGQVVINGAGHEVMIRGTNRDNPILIFVHGGPGCSEIPYVRKYQKELEQHFTIVHYDQRGSGKSYHFLEDYSELTTDVLVEDLLALTDYVTAELGQDKVSLVGHSFGTYIGTKAAAKAPDKFNAYIGIGQVADHVQSELDRIIPLLRRRRLVMQRTWQVWNVYEVQLSEGRCIRQGIWCVNTAVQPDRSMKIGIIYSASCLVLNTMHWMSFDTSWAFRLPRNCF